MLNRRAASLLKPSRLLLVLGAFSIVFSSPAQVAAGPITLSVTTPDFLIPLAGQTGSLTVYSDGSSPTVTGFNSLGTQTFTLAAGATSTGTLTLNLWFSGFPLGDPNYEVTDAFLRFTLDDFDLITDQVTRYVTLKEYAVIKSINGDPLYSPINLANYLPAGTTSTDDKLITLNPIDLMPPLTAADFTNPFIISLKLTAVAKNTGSTSVTLMNTPEAVVTSANLTVSVAPVPEPSTLLLLGSACLVSGWKRSRRLATA
ncbi:MAG: PEP-CTERM sorting domain-containing protein [Vicinamibacterales bacterium]